MKLKLISKKPQVPNTISFIFKPDKSLNWIAGQYMEFLIKNSDPTKKPDERHFTISSAPFEKNIMLTTRFIPGDGSDFKKYLKSLRIGRVIDAKGPDGDFIVEDPNRNYVFIAGGIGITPFRSIILELAHQNKPINITLLYANKTTDFVFKQELEEVQKNNPNFKIHYFVDPQRIDQSIIQNLIPDYKNPNGPIFYVSGPEPMVESFEQMLYQMGISQNKVQRDYFPGYTWPL